MGWIEIYRYQDYNSVVTLMKQIYANLSAIVSVFEIKQKFVSVSKRGIFSIYPKEIFEGLESSDWEYQENKVQRKQLSQKINQAYLDSGCLVLSCRSSSILVYSVLPNLKEKNLANQNEFLGPRIE